MLPRLDGRRILLVDDVISTGASARAGLALLQTAGMSVSAVCVAMIQGDRWRRDWPMHVPVLGAFATPLFEGSSGSGWMPRAE